MKFHEIDDITTVLDRARDMALKSGLVEYASQIERLSNKMQVEADFLYDQWKKTQPVFPVVLVQLGVDDFMRVGR